MPGADFRGTDGYEGQGIVIADGFSTGGVPSPNVVTSTTITFEPPSLGTGAFAVSNEISISGVTLGDGIDLFPPYDTQGIIYQASPSSAGNIKISLINCSAGTVGLASGTWGIVVKRRA